jgi:hypothetical protein
MKPLVALGALGVYLGAALLALSGASSAQTVGTSRTKIPQDPAAIELNRLLTAAQDAASKNDFASAAQDYRDYLAKKPVMRTRRCRSRLRRKASMRKRSR